MRAKNLDDICYNTNPLIEVVARVDLVSPVEKIEKKLPKNLAKAALRMFPIDEPKPAFHQELVLSQKEVQTKRTEFTEWNFYGKAREKRLVITPQAIFVSYKKYESFEALRDEFWSVLQTFFSSCDSAQPSRLGLRYINQLRQDDGDPLLWDRYVDKQLLGLLDYTVKGAKPSRVFHNLEFAFGDFNLLFQFGLHNPDYPAPIRQREFILDLDAYFKGLFEPADIPASLHSYHTEIQRLFERSITPETRKALNADK